MSQIDTKQLIEAASEFALHPGFQNDAATKEFLDRFPLPVLLNALQNEAHVPGLESALVACLERIFRTQRGASLIPQYMPFIQVGLQAESHGVRCLACKAVSCLLENQSGKHDVAVQLVIDSDVYPLLLDCLINGNEEVSAAAMDAIRGLVNSPQGMALVFPGDSMNSTDLRSLATRCSSLGRVRVLALLVKLFSISSSVASVIYNSNLLGLLESEVTNRSDILVSLSVLELLYELAETQHGTEFLSKTNVLKLLCSLISDTSAETILRSRAMLISGRLLSNDNVSMFVDDSSIEGVIRAIEGRLVLLESQDNDEYESALEALGQTGSSMKGAELLLSNAQSASRHVISAAFDRQSHGSQLAALHALGNLAGVTRSENQILLNGSAEESLRRLIYEIASTSPKLTPSGLFLSVLQQDSEVRIAAYKMLTAMVARPWCLMVICTKQEIINLVTDPHTETIKLGMDAKYGCCKAIHKALQSTPSLDPALTGAAAKVEEAVERGPYLPRRHRPEAQPLVMTAERF
ncbi:unnamed protein product [Rhodiola kirilowii]